MEAVYWVSITTQVVRSNPAHGEVFSIQHYVLKWLATSLWFSRGTPVSSTNTTNRHDITEILLKVALNTIIPIIANVTCNTHFFLVAQDNIANCPSNLVRSPALRAYNGHCYEFITHHHKDWSHARDDCTTKGGHLVTITSSAENQFIMASLNSLNFQANGAWIGLSDQRVEGKWEWVTGNIFLESDDIKYTNIYK